MINAPYKQGVFADSNLMPGGMPIICVQDSHWIAHIQNCAKFITLFVILPVQKNIKIFLILVKYYEMNFFEWLFEINYSDANSWKHAPHKYFFNAIAMQ